MRKRLLCGLAGGIFGMGIAPLVSANLEFAGGTTMGVCGLGGLLLGYLGSLFADAFSSGMGIDAGSTD